MMRAKRAFDKTVSRHKSVSVRGLVQAGRDVLVAQDAANRVTRAWVEAESPDRKLRIMRRAKPSQR
jgi:hypothetical protein